MTLDKIKADIKQKSNSSEHRDGKSIDWNNEHQCRINMANLVKEVYTLKTDQKNKCQEGKSYKGFHFEKIKDIKERKKKSIFGAVFKFKSSDKNNDVGPKYVVAFRGTSLESDSWFEDMKMNLRISLSLLHGSRRLKRAMEAVRETIDLNGGCANTVWLAGHSLGAAIALTVGRELVLKHDFNLPTYLFNPPCPHIPATFLLDINNFGKRFARVSRSFLISFLLMIMGKQKDDEEFQKLSTWKPNMYVNSNDYICREYVGYFKHREWMSISGYGNIEMLATQHTIPGIVIPGAKSTLLVPLAFLIINKDNKWKPLGAHALEQWCAPEEEFHGEYRIYDKFWNDELENSNV